MGGPVHPPFQKQCHYIYYPRMQTDLWAGDVPCLYYANQKTNVPCDLERDTICSFLGCLLRQTSQKR